MSTLFRQMFDMNTYIMHTVSYF